MEQIICTNYRLRRKIGAGSFGEIYLAENMLTQQQVAIKLENTNTDVPQLSFESKLYKIFTGGTGIPKIHYYGTDGQYNVMIIDYLGKSLEDLRVLCGNKLSLKTVLMLADQMISCIEYIHNKNFIHRDIKPDNFVMGLKNNSNQVFIIDYGLAKKYREQRTHIHISYSEGKSLTGTARYASIAALEGKEQSRRDDLESLGYVLIYLLRGDLPWMGLPAKTQSQRYRRICKMKKITPFEELCRGFPDEFVQYFKMVRSLEFSETPNYFELKKLFRDLFIKEGFIYDYKYDWVKPINTSNLMKLLGKENITGKNTKIQKENEKTPKNKRSRTVPKRSSYSTKDYIESLNNISISKKKEKLQLKESENLKKEVNDSQKKKVNTKERIKDTTSFREKIKMLVSRKNISDSNKNDESAKNNKIPIKEENVNGITKEKSNPNLLKNEIHNIESANNNNKTYNNEKKKIITRKRSNTNTFLREKKNSGLLTKEKGNTNLSITTKNNLDSLKKEKKNENMPTIKKNNLDSLKKEKKNPNSPTTNNNNYPNSPTKEKKNTNSPITTTPTTNNNNNIDPPKTPTTNNNINTDSPKTTIPTTNNYNTDLPTKEKKNPNSLLINNTDTIRREKNNLTSITKINNSDSKRHPISSIRGRNANTPLRAKRNLEPLTKEINDTNNKADSLIKEKKHVISRERSNIDITKESNNVPDSLANTVSRKPLIKEKRINTITRKRSNSSLSKEKSTPSATPTTNHVKPSNKENNGMSSITKKIYNQSL